MLAENILGTALSNLFRSINMDVRRYVRRLRDSNVSVIAATNNWQEMRAAGPIVMRTRVC